MSTTITLKIRQDSHDDFGSTGTGLLGGTTIQDGKPFGVNIRVVMFFDRDSGGSAFNLPQGASIVSATLRRQAADTANPGSLNFKIHANDADTPAMPTTGAQLDALALTTAATTITAASTTAGGDFDMDCTSAVQELVDRASYCETIVSIVTANNGGTDVVRWNAYENGSANAPRLVIEYDDPPAAGNPYYAYAQQ